MQTVPATTDKTTTPDADYDDGADVEGEVVLVRGAPFDGCCCDDCTGLRAEQLIPGLRGLR
jgi:hypothetical protein